MSQDRGRGKRFRGSNKSKPSVNLGDSTRQIVEGIKEDHPTIVQFKEYSLELDTKHDRYERLVKISRDITIESKRIIFLLHSLDKESKKESILKEADNRLNNLVKVMFKKICDELKGEDSYQYLRAYRPGLEEFIEALTFYWYLKDNSLYNWKQFIQQMSFEKFDTKEMKDLTLKTDNEVESSVTQSETDSMDIDHSSVEILNDTRVSENLFPPTEYILGIADLTGELMRRCINNLSTGNIESCYQTCNFVRSMYKGFISCAGISGREIGRKVYTLKQSLLKMENVCYTIKVRGSEIPEHMLADMAIAAAESATIDEQDEGYQAY